jgi:hypothetical protein
MLVSDLQFGPGVFVIFFCMNFYDLLNILFVIYYILLTNLTSVPGGSFLGVKLTSHIHVVPRLSIRGAIPPLPQYVFMAWCYFITGTTFRTVF